MGRRRTGIVMGVGALLLAAAAGTGAALYLDDSPVAPLTVSWSRNEGQQGCSYHPKRKTVTATVLVSGEAGDTRKVRITVRAYADENTSRQVGSSSREIKVDGGNVAKDVDLTIQVRRRPHIDEDGIAACTLHARGATVA